MDKMAENNSLVQQGVPVMLVAQPIEEDEINLIDLWRTLCKKKVLVAVVTAGVTLIGLAYALLATPVYRVEARLLPPQLQNSKELKLMDTLLSTQGLFNQFNNTLKDITLRRQFFKQYQLAKQLAPGANSQAKLQAAFDDFDQSLQISKDKNHPEALTVIWEGSNPDQITEWTNAFIAMSLKHTKEQSILKLTLSNAQKKLSLKKTLDNRLRVAATGRKDWTIQLKEALKIAKKLDIKESLLSPVSHDSKKELSSVAISLAKQPLYMRGSKAIEAELTSLKVRKDDAPFTPRIRSLQEKLIQLNTLDTRINALRTNLKNFHITRIDQPAFSPQNRIKPQRKIIVLGALFAGLILGIFIAFISATVARSRQEA